MSGSIEKKVVNEVVTVVPEVYKDLAQPAIKEVGSVLGRTTKALLAPVRGMLWGWEKIEIVIEEGVSKRLNKIPEERRQSPPPEIAVPTMQALVYTAQNETLREMYLNLLANSMDVDKDKDVHPSFVDIIKQMNSLDAKVFQRVSGRIGYQEIINPRVSIVGKNMSYLEAMPQWFIGWIIEGYDIFDISTSLIRLNKFGIIELMYDRNRSSPNYQTLANSQYLQQILEEYRRRVPGESLEIGKTESILNVNEYGRQFQRACVE